MCTEVLQAKLESFLVVAVVVLWFCFFLNPAHFCAYIKNYGSAVF